MKVLMLTDDFSDDGIKTFIHEDNLEYDITVYTTREELNEKSFNGFDAILIDYGLLGDDKYLVKKLLKTKSVLAWYGALADRCNKDAKKVFPDEEYLHSLISANLSELCWLLDEIRDKIRRTD